MRKRMKESMQYADSKICSKVSELSPVKIGFALGVVANLPLIAFLKMLGGVGA